MGPSVTGLSSNGFISNPISAIGVTKPVSSYSHKAEISNQNSPMKCLVSEKNLQIEVQSSQQQYRRVLE